MAQVKRLALDLLTRREHSRHELHSKLVSKGCPDHIAGEALADLESSRLLSDRRFAENLVQTRRQRGYGPLRIQREMLDKGVDGELIQRSLDAGDLQWVELSKHVRRKRFGDKLPSNYAERAKQARFLQYRGFTFDQIRCVFDVNDLE